MKIKDGRTLYAAITNTDRTEGRGREYAQDICETRATALRLGKNGYVQGMDCPIAEIRSILVDGQEYIPTRLIKIWEPNKIDIETEKTIQATAAAKKKALAAGLSEEDIRMLAGNLILEGKL